MAYVKELGGMFAHYNLVFPDGRTVYLGNCVSAAAAIENAAQEIQKSGEAVELSPSVVRPPGIHIA